MADPQRPGDEPVEKSVESEEAVKKGDTRPPHVVLLEKLKAEKDSIMEKYREARERYKNSDKKRAQAGYHRLEDGAEQIFTEQIGLEQNEAMLQKIQELTDRLAKAAGFKGQIKLVAINSEVINAFVYLIDEKDVDEKFKEEGPSIYHEGQYNRKIFYYSGLIKKAQEYFKSRGEVLTEGHVASVIGHELGHI